MARDLSTTSSQTSSQNIQSLDKNSNVLNVKSKPILGEEPSKFKKGIEGVKRGFTQGGGKSFIDPFIGTGKGILSTASGISELGQRGLRGITPDFNGKKPEISKISEKFTTPEGGFQKAGFLAEQLGEFMIPTTSILKGRKLIKGSQAIAKLPKKLQGVAKLAGASGLEALGFGGVTAAQEGDINESVGTSAAIGAAFPIAGASYQKFIKPLLKQKIPAKLINSLIKPPSKEFSFGRNPGLAVAKEGIKANSIESLSAKIIAKKNIIGQRIGNLVSHAKGQSNLVDDVGNVVNKHIKDQTDDLVIKRINNTLDQLINIKSPLMKDGQITLETIGKRNIADMSPKELHKFLQKIGKLTQWTGAPADKPINKMLSELYGIVSKHLDKVSGVKPLQQRFANLLGAEKSIERRITSLKPRDVLGLKGIIGGGAIGGLTGDSPGERAINALIGAVAGKAAGSTFIKSRVASGLAKQSTGKIAQRFLGASAKKPLKVPQPDLPKQLPIGKTGVAVGKGRPGIGVVGGGIKLPDISQTAFNKKFPGGVQKFGRPKGPGRKLLQRETATGKLSEFFKKNTQPFPKKITKPKPSLFDKGISQKAAKKIEKFYKPNEIVSRVKKAAKELGDEVQEIHLVGSSSRGKLKSTSDLDLVVKTKLGKIDDFNMSGILNESTGFGTEFSKAGVIDVRGVNIVKGQPSELLFKSIKSKIKSSKLSIPKRTNPKDAIEKSTVGLKKLFGKEAAPKSGFLDTSLINGRLKDVEGQLGVDLSKLSKQKFKSLEQLRDAILKQTGFKKSVISQTKKITKTIPKSFTSLEKEAVKEFKSGMFGSKFGGFTQINKPLRSGVKPSKDIKNVVDNLDSAIKKSKLDKDTKFFRGLLDTKELNLLKNKKVGDVISDKGFTTMTKSQKEALSFTDILNPGRGESGVLIRSTGKKGQQILDISKFTDARVEQDFILNRNLGLKIKKITHKVIDNNNIKIIDVDIIPKLGF